AEQISFSYWKDGEPPGRVCVKITTMRATELYWCLEAVFEKLDIIDYRAFADFKMLLKCFHRWVAAILHQCVHVEDALKSRRQVIPYPFSPIRGCIQMKRI